jgi:hypothetical protein
MKSHLARIVGVQAKKKAKKGKAWQTVVIVYRIPNRGF